MSLDKLEFKSEKLNLIQIIQLNEYEKLKKKVTLIQELKKNHYSLLDFLKKETDLNNQEIEDFIIELDFTGSISSSTKLSELPDSFLNLTYLKCITRNKFLNNNILILSNAGMDVFSLQLFYKLLNTLLLRKITCVVLNYPTSDKSILKEYIDENLIKEFHWSEFNNKT